MEASVKHLTKFPAIVLLLCSFAACGSSPTSRFYVLNAQQTPGSVESDGQAAAPVTIMVGPVIIPDYIDRPQIVTRTGQNKLEMSEFDRWAGSLKDDVSRVLMENLSEILRGDHFSVVSWKRSMPSEARITLEINRLDITPGESVLLKANWTILGKDGKTPLIMRHSTFTEPVAGSDLSTAVAAVSRAFGSLSSEIAAELKPAVAQQNQIPPVPNGE